MFMFCSIHTRHIMPIRWTPLDRLSASALSGLLLGWGIAEALLLLTG